MTFSGIIYSTAIDGIFGGMIHLVSCAGS